MSRINIHPAFKEAFDTAMAIGEVRARCMTVFSKATFDRIDGIIQQQDVAKRAAFYGTTCEAGLWGADYSKVETIRDMGAIYAHYLGSKAFPSQREGQPT